jgi:hypothetical protein
MGTGFDSDGLQVRQRPKRGQGRFMSKRSTPEDRLNWVRIREQSWVNSARIREQIGYQLKKHYQACMTEELPPRLLAALKKLDEEIPESSQSVGINFQIKKRFQG